MYHGDQKDFNLIIFLNLVLVYHILLGLYHYSSSQTSEDSFSFSVEYIGELDGNFAWTFKCVTSDSLHKTLCLSLELSFNASQLKTEKKVFRYNFLSSRPRFLPHFTILLKNLSLCFSNLTKSNSNMLK